MKEPTLLNPTQKKIFSKFYEIRWMIRGTLHAIQIAYLNFGLECSLGFLIMASIRRISKFFID